MRMVDIICKKRDGQALSSEDIDYFVSEFSEGKVPDYQAAALLMAMTVNGLGARETTRMTNQMAKSGEQMELSAVGALVVDKLSTGGVGDKTTLVAVPLVASLGIQVANLSGRGVEHAISMVNKLEAIPGLRTSLSPQELKELLETVGCCIAEQPSALAPAGRKIRLLGKAVGADSPPLTAAGIVSKTIAAGIGGLLLEIRVRGDGLPQRVKQARALAGEIIRLGENAGQVVAARISTMDAFPGQCLGTGLEVLEAADTLQGRGPEDLTRVSLEQAAELVRLATGKELDICFQRCRQALLEGKGFAKLLELVQAQGGDVAYLTRPQRFPKAELTADWTAQADGFLSGLDWDRLGRAVMLLSKAPDGGNASTDYSAGLQLLKKTGDKVSQGEPLVRLYANQEERLVLALGELEGAAALEEEPPEEFPLLLERIGK